jgi:hypothetical protein
MPQHIQAPDGSIVEFPDGMSDAQMAAAMRKAFPATGYDKARGEAEKRARFQSNDPVTRTLDMATRPFNDEVAGGFAAFGQGASNVVRNALGQPVEVSMRDAYRANRDFQKARDDKWAAEHPVSSGAAELIGGLVGGPGKAVAGAAQETNALLRVAKGAARTLGTGAAYGAAYGAADADEGHRVQGAIRGGVAGAATAGVLGTTAAVGGKMVGKAGNALADIGRAATRGGREPALTPRGQAQANNALLDLVANKGGRAAVEAEAARYGDKPVTAAEVLGRPGVQTLGAVARRTGKTADALEGALDVREAGRGQRIVNDFADTLGVRPEAAEGRVNDFVAAKRDAAGPLYTQAYAQPVNSPALDRLSKAAPIKRAMAEAEDLIHSEAAAKGFDPESVKPGSTQHWDYVKRALDDQIEALKDPVTGRWKSPEKANALMALNKAVRDAMVDANPTYGKALAESGDYLRVNEAFGRGRKLLLDTKANPRAVADRFGKLSPAEQEAERAGVANFLLTSMENGRLKPSTFKTPAVQAKLKVWFGEEGAAKFIDRMAAEGDMAKYGSRMKPGVGSPTMEFLDAGNQQDHLTDGLVDFGGRVARGQGPISAFIGTGLKKGGAYLETAGTPVEVRDEMGRVLSMHPDEFVGWLQDMEAQMGARQPRRPLPKSPYGVIGGSSQREDARATP